MNDDIIEALREAGDDAGAARGFAMDDVLAKGRRRQRTKRLAVGIAGAASVAVVAGVGWTSLSNTTGGTGANACAAVVVLDGQSYSGHGDLMRIPATTGRTDVGRRPSCDDSGGQQPEDPAVDVEVEEIKGIPISQAFLVGDSFYIRDGADLPELARPWFRPQTCDPDGPTGLTGRWLGVTTQIEPRFDGDLRPPYRIDFRIDETQPDHPAYAGWRVVIRVPGVADPALTPQDVEDALWDGAPLTVRVHCEGKRFVADGFRVER